jgi:hypothetical protein
LAKPKHDCELPLSEYHRFLEKIRPIKDGISSTNPEVLFFNPNDLFCGKSKCVYTRDGLPLLRDRYHHLSEYGSVELIKRFSEWAAIQAPSILK